MAIAHEPLFLDSVDTPGHTTGEEEKHGIKDHANTTILSSTCWRVSLFPSFFLLRTCVQGLPYPDMSCRLIQMKGKGWKRELDEPTGHVRKGKGSHDSVDTSVHLSVPFS